MSHSDTPREMLQKQADLHRDLTGLERIAMADELTRIANELALAGIRARHPEFTEDEVVDELYNALFGPELAAPVIALRRERRRAERPGE